MSREVKVGPPQIAIHEGHVVLLTEPDGSVNWPSDKGLYFFDTRLISAWAIFANGQSWELLNSGAVNHYSSRPTAASPARPATCRRGRSAWC